MYVGALYPAGLMIGLYLVYVVVMTIMRPNLAPALPAEVRTLGGGVISLIVMLVLAVAVHFITYATIFSEFRYEVRFVWSATTATAFALGVSLLNRYLKLGLLSRLAEQVIIVLIPPLALIFLVLGTIFLGIATPTEGGAMGATGALVMALFKRRLNYKTLNDAMLSTTKLSAFVMFILIGARVFGLTFYGLNGDKWIEDLLLSLPGAEYGFLFTVTLIVFILGMFLDFFEIAFIIVPLLAPVAQKLGIDLIWFGIILGINLQASFLTPPFGFALFYLRSIAPKQEWLDKSTGKMMPAVKTLEIYKGAVPYIVIQMAMVLIVIAFPKLVTHYKTENEAAKPANQQIELPPLNGGSLGLPPLPGAPDSNNGGLPGLTLPPLNMGGDTGKGD
jgi:TRAP-type mannitol/chloroaromatic compound transport system permease large subunit